MRYTVSHDRYPMCGDPIALKKDSYMQFDGSIEKGSAQMLHCQLGNSSAFKPVALFHIDCSKTGPVGEFDADNSTFQPMFPPLTDFLSEPELLGKKKKAG
uniref:Uncharacterized protein n=1 Tax=Lotharella oceanica TaxID=641309 RepID=A0A7S2TEH9_9EUKA|mmetsp:Transcript_10236/g.19680  ORF Transcript_10236/g.19680 Transcript_10236/m.19680 type:complete len:100 (+) Transcript_10236:556-855(+)|eukprot:CAMPEP_0170184100 /NCGR_PEP_ID=MMETSP0040_2-20121228/32700_1 /TAXON_ID=641309 /ORGANISM="Lotharella oceanica, Strain CCMP622" /LENGTH=99 /DNA_ID=CAMNT_0010430053 /DNA_START=593 /DNA_END=892 /DNA_ORIENTATION=+